MVWEELVLCRRPTDLMRNFHLLVSQELKLKIADKLPPYIDRRSFLILEFPIPRKSQAQSLTPILKVNGNDQDLESPILQINFPNTY